MRVVTILVRQPDPGAGHCELMPRARQPPDRRPTPSGSPQTTGQTLSKVVGKALDALDRIRAASGPVSLNELTREIGLAKTSLFRILHTLEVAGYLERDPDGRYRAPAALRAGSRLPRSSPTCSMRRSR